MNSNKYIFKISYPNKLNILFLIIGTGALVIGLDMGFSHWIISKSSGANEIGYIIGTWFLIIVGGLVMTNAFRMIRNPLTIFSVNREGIGVKANPGFGRSLSFIPWTDIKDIGEGEIYIGMSNTGAGSISHPSLKLVLKPNSTTVKNKLTDASVNWENGEVDIDATLLCDDLAQLIEILKRIKEKPDSFPERNTDFKTFIKKHN